MKKKQKIIVAVSAVFVVVIGIIVAVVVSNKNNRPEDTEEITSNTCAAGYEIIEETEAEIVTEKSTQSNSPVTQAITSDNNNNDAEEKVTHEIIQNYKNYDLNTAEILAEKSASFGKVKLYSAKSDKYRINLIEATSNGKKYYYEFFGSSEIKDIILKNVDGQKGDEIIIIAKKSNGTYDNLVIKLTQSNMISLLSESEIHEISSMYTSELKENFNVNVYCGSSKMTVNVKNINKEDYTGSYWDASGKLIEEFTEDPIWFDNTFSSLEAKDIDGDGVCEIICTQYASMGDFDSCVGYAKTTIKYDTEYDKFVVINSTFIPAK